MKMPRSNTSYGPYPCEKKVAKVVDIIQTMLDKGLRERPGIFF